MTIDATALLKLAEHWERGAGYIEKRNQSINRSKCHDGKRQLNVGLAAAYRSAADQLRKSVDDYNLASQQDLVATGNGTFITAELVTDGE